MTTDYKTIKNPLTIIAIFAGLVEVCGSVVLPNMPPEPQRIFVWFVMLFPSALLIFFFITLYFNHKVLYAPSDYSNEDNFFKDIPRRGQKGVVIRKVKEDVLQFATEEKVESTDDITVVDTGATSRPSNIEPSAEQTSNLTPGYRPVVEHPKNQGYKDILEIEQLAVRQLQMDIGNVFQQGVEMASATGGKNDFSGICFNHEKILVADIKYFDSNASIYPRLISLFGKAQDTYGGYEEKIQRRIEFIFVCVLDDDVADSVVFKISDKIRGSFHSLPVNVKFYRLADLRREFAKTNASA